MVEISAVNSSLTSGANVSQKSPTLVRSRLSDVNANDKAKLTTPHFIAVQTHENGQRLSVFFMLDSSKPENDDKVARFYVYFPLDILKAKTITGEDISSVDFNIPVEDNKQNLSSIPLKFSELSTNLQDQILCGINGLLGDDNTIKSTNEALAKSLARPVTPNQ